MYAYFSCLGSMITHVARRTHEIQSRIAMKKVAFYKKTLFTDKLVLNLRTKLIRSYIWNENSFVVLKLWYFR